ncbi:aryl-sulfate sulfotransferase [Siminovitchia sediminis]|uniref:Aryl-sulfate sulfotransferase n=1 Tax=Siminovitchia sediminis TaxID=1274353 RepID=A0ABW4KHY3_9BACI
MSKNLRIWTAAILLVIPAVLIYFIASTPLENAPPPEEPEQEAKVQSFPEDYDWIPLPDMDLKNPGNMYELPSLTTEAKNVLDLRSLSDHQVQVNGEDVTGKDSYPLTVETISDEDFITLTVDGKNHHIRTLPQGLSGYTVDNKGAEDGFYYFTYGDYIVKMNASGQIVYYKNLGTAYSFDFKLNTTEDGKKYYSYLVQNRTEEKVKVIGYQTTKAVIMDEHYRVVDEVDSLIPTDLVEPEPLENHDFLLLDLGHYVVSSYYAETVTNIPAHIQQKPGGANVMAAYLQEIKNQEVIWEWKSTEYPEFYEQSVEHNDFTNEHAAYADYMHFNAITVDPGDHHFVVSFRNLDSLVKLNRNTGEVMWILGGKGDQFGLTEEQQFRRQHKVSVLSDGSLLFFNNGNVLPVAPYPIVPEEDPLRKEQAETTIVKVRLDEENKQIESFESFPTGHFSATRGSVHMLDEDQNIVLIGWGSGENNEEHFTEVNLNTGEKLLTFYPHDEDLISYRVYKFAE